MASERTKVEIFYDVVSPYTWVGFEVLCRYRQHWNMDLVLRPFFLGGVMKETGNRPPMMVPKKGAYMYKDLERISAYYGVPLNPMENPYETIVEKGSLKAMRFLTAISMHCPNYLEPVSRELWTRIWTREEDIVDPESLRAAAKKVNMTDADIDRCLKDMDGQEVRNALKQTTEDALAYGAFGAPTIIVHTKNGPEMFFGSDRFPLIAHMMNEPWKGPFPDRKSSL